MFSALKQYQGEWACAEQLSLSHARESKLRFMRQHGRAVYQQLTNGVNKRATCH
jgi:hypothetical protein